MVDQGASMHMVPYRQDGEPERRATLARVPVELPNLSDDDLQVLGHLVEAVEAINPVFRHQHDPRTFRLRRLLDRLASVAEAPEAARLDDYRTVLDLQNAPFASLPRKNHILGLPAERLLQLAHKAGGEMIGELEALGDLLTRPASASPMANLYPADLTEQEFAALGPLATRVNSSVLRGPDGTPRVVLNEERYRDALAPVIEHLAAARDLTTDPGFRLYLDAKIEELRTGSEEARRVADADWVRHTSPIDVAISSGLETYLDDYKNARGAAAGGVYIVNRSAEALLAAIIDHVPAFEATAPWTHKRLEVDCSRLPRLKFVDVLAWAGDYVGSPMTTLAQSLPNDMWIAKQVGTINMVYVNTSRVAIESGGRLWPDRFLTQAESDLVREYLFTAYQTHTALHEIGHATGRMDDAHLAGQPSDYLEEETGWLEELRAELFGLWAITPLVEDGVLAADMARAGDDAMLLAVLGAIRFEPAQAHTSAHNAIFHWLEEHGAFRRTDQDGELRFEVDHSRSHEVAAGMLKVVGDLRAAGDKAGAVRLRQKYVFSDPLQAEIERRMADLPLGCGLIFPRLSRVDGRYARPLVYPVSFSAQPKFGLELQGSTDPSLG